MRAPSKDVISHRKSAKSCNPLNYYYAKAESRKIFSSHGNFLEIGDQAPLFVEIRFINRETGEIKEQEVFMGDFPLMTPRGSSGRPWPGHSAAD